MFNHILLALVDLIIAGSRTLVTAEVGITPCAIYLACRAAVLAAKRPGGVCGIKLVNYFAERLANIWIRCHS